MYPYHNRIKQRIRNGELVGIEPSKSEEYAFVFVFSTPPHTRPIRHHSVCRYEKELGKFIQKNDEKGKDDNKPL